MPSDRLAQQIEFIVEVDRLKQVFRQTLLMDASRRENDAEHSWHLALMAVLLAEYSADPSIDILRAVKMALVHDIVEIDCGDTFCYDNEANIGKLERETKSADRIFSILPPDLASDVRALWDEFEARQTPEAKFAASLDRLQPLLHNFRTEGAAWRRHGVIADQVIERNCHIAEGAPALWEFASGMIEDAVRKGYLAPAPDQ